jgi:hypothetical protein
MGFFIQYNLVSTFTLAGNHQEIVKLMPLKTDKVNLIILVNNSVFFISVQITPLELTLDLGTPTSDCCARVGAFWMN